MPSLKRIFIIVIIIVRLKALKLQNSLDIKQLITTHKYVTNYLQKGKEHPVLNKYARLYKKEHMKMDPAEDFVGNPINVILLVKRLSIDLQLVEKYMVWIRKKSDGMIFPEVQDFFNTAVSFWRLKVIYNLNVSHLAAGKLYGHFSHDAKPYFDQALTMLTSDCMELAYLYYYNHKEYNLSLLWALEGLKKYYDKEPDEIFPDVDESNIVHFIMLCYMKIGDYKKAIEWSRKYMSLRPELMQDLDDDPFDDSFPFPDRYKDVSHEKEVDIDFDDADRLCRGEVQPAHEKRKSLHCYFKCGPNPFLRLAPFKAEQLHEEPPILIFYDVVSEAKFNTIKHGVMDKLRPSNVSIKGNPQMDRESRLSLSASIDQTDGTLSPATRSVAGDMLRLAADVTDLNMNSYQDLQVIRYGVGEYYKVHHDFYEEPNPVYGNRIATALFYLSDVEQGGATVFIGARLTVYPVKGAVLLWYNLVPSGQPDYRTLHASCPVLRGTKWVLSLWIYELLQEFIRPCGLENQGMKPSWADFNVVY